jgi:hypothetical protein
MISPSGRHASMPVFFVITARMSTRQLAQILISPNKLPLDPRFFWLAALSASAPACCGLRTQSTCRSARARTRHPRRSNPHS